jgi:hypothetical protein
MGHVEQPAQICADDRIPVLGRDLVEHAVAGDAGIVDEHLDRPEIVLDPGDPFLAGLVIANVPSVHRNAGLFPECAGNVIIADIAGRNPVTRLLQSNGNCRADPARSSRYQSDPGHVFLPAIFV